MTERGASVRLDTQAPPNGASDRTRFVHFVSPQASLGAVRSRHATTGSHWPSSRPRDARPARLRLPLREASSPLTSKSAAHSREA